MFFSPQALKEITKFTSRPLYPKKFYFSEIAPLCSKNEVDIRRQKAPGNIQIICDLNLLLRT